MLGSRGCASGGGVQLHVGDRWERFLVYLFGGNAINISVRDWTVALDNMSDESVRCFLPIHARVHIAQPDLPR